MALSFSEGAGVRFHCSPVGQHILAYHPQHTHTSSITPSNPQTTRHKIYCISELYLSMLVLLFELFNLLQTAGLFFLGQFKCNVLKGINLLVGLHLALSFGMLESVIGFFSPCAMLYNSSCCAICVSLCARLLYVPNCYSCG